MLRTGNCRYCLPKATDVPDQARVRKEIKTLLRACGQSKEAEMDRIIDAHFGTRTQDAVNQYILMAHFHDCDVEYTFGARTKASLRPGPSRHADRKRSHADGCDRGTAPPLPNRPLQGNSLGDGVLQSEYHWNYRLATRAIVGQSPAGQSPPAVPVPPPATPGARGAPYGSLDAPLSSRRLQQTPAPAVPPVRQQATPAFGPAAVAAAAARVALAEAKEAAKAAAVEWRRQLGWSRVDDLRRVDPHKIAGEGRFVGSFLSAVTLSERSAAHARECSGNLVWNVTKMVRKGCGGKMADPRAPV